MTGLVNGIGTRRPECWRRSAAEVATNREWWDILLRELQHRAKNNLALVAAMVARERRIAAAERDARAVGRFDRLLQRITAIALAQDHLSAVTGGAGAGGLGGGTAMDLAAYLRALLSSLETSLGGRIVAEAEFDRCVLPFDKALAVGLAMNELVTNAAKHAYPEGEDGGVVRVALRVDAGREEAALTVADEGRGMDPAAVRPATRGGQGSKLLRHLARQLGGEVGYGRPERGTSVTLRFPLLARSPPR